MLAYLPPFSGAVLGHYKPILPWMIKIDQQMFENLKGAAQPPTTLDDFLRFYLPELPAIDSIITPCYRNKMEYFFVVVAFASINFVHRVHPYSWLKPQVSREAHIMTYKLPEILYLDSNDGSNYPPVNQHRHREKNRCVDHFPTEAMGFSTLLIPYLTPRHFPSLGV